MRRVYCKKVIEILKYNKDHSSVEENIIRQCIREGLPLPGRIQEAPTLSQYDAFYYIGFMDLTTCRNDPYMGISWRDIVEYCNFHDIQDKEEFIYTIQCIDSEYLQWRSAELSKS